MNLRAAALLVVAAPLFSAQTPLINDGKPMRLTSQCNAEDMTAAGLSCPPDEPCPIYLELNGFQAVGARLFVSGDFHTSTVTLYSLLLSSDDSGRTWTDPYPRERAVTLDQMQFIDFQYGWVSGETVQNLPHDPFLLATTDGGKTWNRQFLFEDERPGVIEKFEFDSRTDGVILIDTGAGMRHQLFETKTGGRSWMMRQESADSLKFPASRALQEPQAWRLRADAKTHSYQIEKRDGENWTPVASFLVEAGSCRE